MDFNKEKVHSININLNNDNTINDIKNGDSKTDSIHNKLKDLKKDNIENKKVIYDNSLPKYPNAENYYKG